MQLPGPAPTTTRDQSTPATNCKDCVEKADTALARSTITMSDRRCGDHPKGRRCRNLGGVHLVDAASFRAIGFIPTGPDAHGLYPSRDSRRLYVSNRRGASISVIDFASHVVVATWSLPGTSPDMGGVSANGTVLWLSGRYHDAVYAMSTGDSHLTAKIHVPHRPRGLCVWPQPGRYSLGLTGVMR